MVYQEVSENEDDDCDDEFEDCDSLGWYDVVSGVRVENENMDY